MKNHEQQQLHYAAVNKHINKSKMEANTECIKFLNPLNVAE